MEGRALPSLTVTALAGTPQSAVVDTAFATPLQALVQDSGSPVAGASVTFDAPSTALRDPTGTFPPPPPNGVSSVTVQTDANGVATAPTFTAFYHTGEYTVTASVPGGTTTASFDLTNLPGPPARIGAIAFTTPQAATVGTAYGTAFQVAVEDAYQNSVRAGVNVTFTAPAGGAGGTFAGGTTSVTVPTDASGNATAPAFTANGTAGTYQVSASVSGVSTPAAFGLENVNPDAAIDWFTGTGPAQAFLSPAGAVGSVSYAGPIGDLGGGAGTLTGLTSLTLIGHSSNENSLVVTPPAAGPLLPGPIRFSAGAGACNLQFQTGAAVVTRPGEVLVNGQAVLYNAPGLRIQLGSSSGVNAGVTPLYPAPAGAFDGHGHDVHGNPLPMTPAEGFVQTLYLDALGRAGTLAEVDSWVARMQALGNAPAIAAAGIEASPEARDRLVKAWYQTYLGRPAQGGEELGWVNELATDTEEQVLSQILGVPGGEFYQRAQGLAPSGTPDQRYVAALYQVLLGRPAERAEVAAWGSALPALGPSGVAAGLLHSREFRTDQFEGYYNALLHRPGDAAGLDAWVNSGSDIRTARIGFESGPEFYSGS